MVGRADRDGRLLPPRAASCRTPSVVDPSIFKAYDVRGTYPDQMDEDVAYRIGRAFARVLGAARGQARGGPARGARRATCGCPRRPWPPATPRGWSDEGVDVLDIGMAGTEMLYWTVGSRDLDGGLMCTASHNPKAYTGAKLVRSGALALSGDSGIGELRDLVAAGEPGPPAGDGAAVHTEDVSEPFRAAALEYIDRRRDRAAEGRARRRQRHGGADGGAAARPLPDRAGADLLDAGRRVPRPRAQPAARGEPALHHRQGARRGRRPRASPGTATPTAASSSTTPASSWTGTSSPRCWPSRCFARSPAPRCSTTCAPRARCATWSSADGGTALVNRVGHAFFKTRMRETGAVFGGEVSGHYYFRDFYCADSGTLPALLILELLSTRGQVAQRAAAAAARALLHLRGDQLRGRGPGRQDAGARGALLERRGELARRRVRGLRGLALQRAPVEHRAAPAAQPRVAVSAEHMAEKRDEVLALIRA